jgi:NADP-dependent aldehyde dehydrogenase
VITTIDPRTGTTTATDLEPTPNEEVRRLAELARKAAPDLARWGRHARAGMLEAIARALETRREELVSVADSETGLGATRLNSELSRSKFQFSLFAEAIREGSYLEAAIDHATETVLGPQPDVRRLLVPLGPVAVFGSSNFPFAFSVLGGDVASALAAGSPVISKAHSSHPLTSRLSYEVLARAVREACAPEGTLGIVYGQSAGTVLVTDPEIAAVGFTGSLGAAEGLQAAIVTRKEPIPFFGELSSVNPLVVTEAAACARSGEIAQDLFGSYTGSGGQLCTKPGIAFVPAGAAGEALVADLVALTSAARSAVLLNDRIHTAFGTIEDKLREAGAGLLARGEDDRDTGFTVQPTLLITDAADVDARVAEECFGPLLVIARYTDISEVHRALMLIPRSLTVTVHMEDSDEGWLAQVSGQLQEIAGRLVFNGYPTGVRVSWAQTHGGPWPATNTRHTSVGVTAIRRWLRPVSWQNAPQGLLPPELRDGPVEVVRREDGVLVLPQPQRSGGPF